MEKYSIIIENLVIRKGVLEIIKLSEYAKLHGVTYR